MRSKWITWGQVIQKCDDIYMKTINRALNWILLSSKHPMEASLTAKGVVVMYIPLVITLLGLTNLNIDGSAVNQIVDATFNLLNAILTLVGLAITLVGLIRKTWLTATGKSVNTTI